MNKIDKYNGEKMLISPPGQLLLKFTYRTTGTAHDITSVSCRMICFHYVGLKAGTIYTEGHAIGQIQPVGSTS